MVSEQLDLNDELKRIGHLLRGHSIETNEDGNEYWDETSMDNPLLSDYGVRKIMQYITFYLNKNKLLSNYTEEIINEKMEDFGISLADNIFMKYDLYFNQPTFEEIKKVFEDKAEAKRKMRGYVYEVMNLPKNDKEINKEIMLEAEFHLEKQFEVIKAQLFKEKLKDFDMIMREIQDCVHDTYLRALNGSERSSLRKHWNITENMGSNNNLNNNGKSGFTNWMRR